MKTVLLLTGTLGGWLTFTYWPLLVVLLAPICGDLFHPIEPGSMLTTPRNTVVCSTYEATAKLSSRSMIDLPPWVLFKNGCHPSAKVQVRVAEVRGKFLAVQFPRANNNREWWMPVGPASIIHH